MKTYRVTLKPGETKQVNGFTVTANRKKGRKRNKITVVLAIPEHLPSVGLDNQSASVQNDVNSQTSPP